MPFEGSPGHSTINNSAIPIIVIVEPARINLIQPSICKSNFLTTKPPKIAPKEIKKLIKIY